MRVAERHRLRDPRTQSPPSGGSEHHGLRTRLTLVSNRTAVGQPIEVKCELQNVGTVPRTINLKDWNGHRGFAVIGPDGKECELLAMPFTGFARDTEIKPEETRTLFELDIAPHFLIQTAGEHTLRLHGGPPSKVGDIEEGRTPIPPPNDVVVTLAAGELTRLQTLFLKLRKLAPAGWRSYLTGSSFGFNGDGESKNLPLSEASIVHLWFADTEFSEAATKKHAAKRSEPTPPIIRFGETDFGFGHLSVTPTALRHWSKCVEQIRAEIPISKPQPNQRSEVKPPGDEENQQAQKSDPSEKPAASDNPRLFRLKVVGPNGLPVANAKVEFRGSRGVTAEQSQRGKFVEKHKYGTIGTANEQGELFVNLPRVVERFSFSVEQPGFGPYWGGWDSEINPQQVVPDEITAQLDAAWSVGGVLVDEAGVPIADARVRPSIEFKKLPGDNKQFGVGAVIRTDAKGAW